MGRFGAVAVLILALAGCGDASHGYHQAFDPLPPADGLVRRMGEGRETYRNLSVVPARPTDVPTYAANQATASELEKQRAANRAAGDALRADARLPTDASGQQTATPRD